MCTAIMGLVAAFCALLAWFSKKPAQNNSGKSRCPFSRFFKKQDSTSDSALKPDSDSADSAAKRGQGWQERYLGGSKEAEDRFIARAVKDIGKVQNNNRKTAGLSCFARAFHAKIQAGLQSAQLRVASDLPPELALGFLKAGAEYKASVRFSSAAGIVKADSAKDLRGIAVRLELENGEIHDFLATNGSASHARDARQFIEFAKASSGSKVLLLPRLILSVGLFETIRIFATVLKQVKRPVESLATETYFSRSAFAFGDCAVRFQFSPANCSAACLHEKGPDYLRLELIERLKQGPVVFDLQVQFFKNEKSTPIEDGSIEWASPLVTIAQLLIPQQDLSTAEAKEACAEVEALQFNPWNVARGFRPLGSLNRARLAVYKASVALRQGSGRSGSGSSQSHFPKADKSMNDDTSSKGKCPFGFGNKAASPESPALYRPKSSRQGIGALKYVWWNMFYHFFQTLNVWFAPGPNRKVSWDRWPSTLGLLYLMGKIRFNRSNALTDPYDYATNDNREYGKEPEKAKHEIAPDGSWVSDRDNPQMGTPGTRFGSNIPPKKIRPDVENMTPSAREVGKLRWRRLDENGREITVPALILNDLAGGWIQFQFHNFGGNTMRDPVSKCPHLMARDPKENWPGNVAVIDRTTADPTRVTENGRPTPVNEKVVAWIQGQIYGSNESELSGLRSFAGGKFLMDESGRLPEDPAKPGIDLTGFNNNYNPLLSFLHWLFVQEHNAIAEHYAFFHPDWDDEKLFQMARKVNVAQIARIHTIQWTEDLLQHPTLQLGMHADWYGFLGQRLKMYLMRLEHRHSWLKPILKPFKSNDFIWGMPGSKWEHHDGPFQVPKHFRMVYRLHEMVLSEREIVEPGSDRLLERVALADFIHGKTRDLVARYGYETLAWSFVRKSCGALTLHNFPRALTQFENQQDGVLTDLAERDIFRERTDGTGTYNEFRVSLGERPVGSFLELTGGDSELARELEIVYEGDVDAVDAGIGILAEPKPAGFALGFCQFYQFVLNAPRRVKSNRHLTEGFSYEEYAEGMDWVEHGGGMLGAMSRHLPGIRAQMEGVSRAFAPWKDTETFPQRQLDQCLADTGKVVKADLITLGLAALTGIVAVLTGAVSWIVPVGLVGLMALVKFLLTGRRMLAMRYMQVCWKKCYTDKRGFYFGTLSRACESIRRAAHFGSLHAMAVLAVSLGLALFFAAAGHPFVSVLLALVAASALAVRSASRKFVSSAEVLKIALRNRMREGQEKVSVNPGKCALETRRSFNSVVPSQLAARANCDRPVYDIQGEIDMAEFELLFKLYAPGRDHLTAYDFARMVEGLAVMDAKNGRGNCVSRFLQRFSDMRRAHELIYVFADMIVEEDKKLVPAISREMLLAYYAGSAQAQLKREMEQGDRDPSPVVCR